jgi:hypothetical protein
MTSWLHTDGSGLPSQSSTARRSGLRSFTPGLCPTPPSSKEQEGFAWSFVLIPFYGPRMAYYGFPTSVQGAAVAEGEGGGLLLQCARNPPQNVNLVRVDTSFRGFW